MLAATFNHDTTEIAADPVHMMYVLEKIDSSRAASDRDREALPGVHQGRARSRYAEFIGNEIQKAYLEWYHDYGQNLFDRYVSYADAWIEDIDFKVPTPASS